LLSENQLIKMKYGRAKHRIQRATEHCQILKTENRILFDKLREAGLADNLEEAESNPDDDSMSAVDDEDFIDGDDLSHANRQKAIAVAAELQVFLLVQTWHLYIAKRSNESLHILMLFDRRER